ncbi:MAG TPA: GNAT family N-acetyltransferase [Acidimicrobiia bacterium]|nr:GNAT family N-acetyltransferase [Acidimicrobiia bacterium]
MTGIGVRKATAADMALLTNTLVAAFEDDPVMRWCAPSDTRWRRAAEAAFAAAMRVTYLPKDEVYMAEDGLSAALWAPPDKWQSPASEVLRLLLPYFRLCGSHLPRTLRLLNTMEARHKQHAEPHRYLAFIGTAPSAQGKGYGTSLLSAMLDRCDAEGLGAYLEASSSRNEALYFRHGFEVVDEIRVGNSPPLRPMWRKPR